jgi:hypothetical protein
MGGSGWKKSDRSIGYERTKDFHGIHRGLKHISLVTSILAGGDHMIFFLVYSQVTDTVVRKLETEGFRIGIDITLKKRAKPYMNATLFKELLSTVLLPYIARVQSNPGLKSEPAGLLTDNCSVRMHDDTLK